MKCYGCGVEKDPDVEEEYTGEIMDKGMQPPLIVLECETFAGYKAAVVCLKCFDRISPDMWISEDCWKKIDPRIPVDQLPMFDPEHAGRWDAKIWPNL